MLFEDNMQGNSAMSMFGSPDDAQVSACDAGWLIDDNKVYCPNCCEYDEVMDRYVHNEDSGD